MAMTSAIRMVAGRLTRMAGWLLAAVVVFAPGAARAGETPGAAPAPESSPAPAAAPTARGMPPSPLALGLAWLAKVQEDDGHWDATKYQGKAEPETVTAFALLAFLGNLNSSKAGKYKRNVRAAQGWLVGRFESAMGRFGDAGPVAALTMWALAEAWAMSDDEALRPIVQSMVDHALAMQDATGGWAAQPSPVMATPEVDVRTSGRWALALKTAQVAGAKFPDDPETGNWQEKLRGRFAQIANATIAASSHAAPGDRDRLADQAAVALACLQIHDASRSAPAVKGCVETLLGNEWTIGQRHGYDGVVAGGKTDYRGWYWQTLGVLYYFTYGRENRRFATIAERMAMVITGLQEKDGPNHGSWPSDHGRDAPDGFEAQVGRVGVTATACLIIETMDGLAHIRGWSVIPR